MSHEKDSTMPMLAGEVDFFGWWKWMIYLIKEHPEVAYLDPENDKFSGWTTEYAKKRFCGEKPPDEFREKEPVNTKQLPTFYNTRASSTSSATQEDRDEFVRQQIIAAAMLRAWRDKKEVWIKSKNLYMEKEDVFLAELNIIDDAIDRSVTTRYSRYFVYDDGPQEKIIKVLKKARPTTARLRQRLYSQYQVVINIAPKNLKLLEDPTFDAWLARWQVMVKNQCEQGGTHILSGQWLFDFARIFEQRLPRITTKVIELAEDATDDQLTNVDLVERVLAMVQNARTSEFRMYGDKKRTRGQAFATLKAAEPPSDGERETRRRMRPAH